MKRHILDQPKKLSSAGLMEAFARDFRKSTPDSATLALQQRPKTRPGSRRLQEFARIQHGKLA